MKILCKNKHWNIPEDYNINKILYLLIDRPDYINLYNDFSWENNEGYFHRDYDLPDYISDTNFITWSKNGGFIRENNKPSVIKFDGYKQYYTNGKFVKEEKPK